MISIDLSSFAGGMVIAGRSKGAAARDHFHLDQVDEAPELATVKIPLEVISLNSSFFLGMFGQSIQKLGREKFLEKYNFECAPVLLDDIMSGIRQALNKANPLVSA
jgi:hypothetical protein